MFTRNDQGRFINIKYLDDKRISTPNYKRKKSFKKRIQKYSTI